MNFTEQQVDLLRRLVSNNEANGGAEFYFNFSAGGGAISYARNAPGIFPCDETDLLQLRSAGALTLITLAPSQYRGKPTQSGIDFIRGSMVGHSATASAGSRQPPASSPDGDPSFNPFREGTRAHEITKDMLLELKERSAFLQAELVESLPREGASSQEFLEYHVKALADMFDIWCRAIITMPRVLSDDVALAYEQLITAIEEHFLPIALSSRSSFLPHSLFASEVKLHLAQRKAYWIGRVLRLVREHKEAMRSTAVVNRGDPPTPEEATGHTGDGAIADTNEVDRAGAPESTKESGRALNVGLVRGWLDDEGWTNETLALKLKISERAISSLRNNGGYHGMDAITKLANLMGLDPEDLYLPEASS